MREAPSRVVIQELLRRGASVRAYDPVAMTEARRVLGDLPGLDFAVSAAATLQGADALLVITEWKEFKSPDFDGLVVALQQAVVFVQTMGIEYHGVGRGVPVGS